VGLADPLSHISFFSSSLDFEFFPVVLVPRGGGYLIVGALADSPEVCVPLLCLF